jgi:hypothetical protein
MSAPAAGASRTRSAPDTFLSEETAVKSRLIILGVIVAIALCVGAFFGIQWMMREGELSKFKDLAQSYAQTPGEPDGGEPRVVGKVLPINLDGRKPDHLYFDMPEGMRAAKPEEVGTVVLLNWGKEQVGTYTGGGAAYQQTCQVTVVNHKTKKVIVSQMFLGGEPPQTTKSSTATGSSPGPDIVRFLGQLPKSDK